MSSIEGKPRCCVSIYYQKILFYSTKCGLRGAESQLDKDNNTISVEHAYPSTDKDWPGQTRNQGGMVQIQVPTRSKMLIGLLAVDFPDRVVNGIHRYTNSLAWQDGAPGAQLWPYSLDGI